MPFCAWHQSAEVTKVFWAVCSVTWLFNIHYVCCTHVWQTLWTQVRPVTMQFPSEAEDLLTLDLLSSVIRLSFHKTELSVGFIWVSLPSSSLSSLTYELFFPQLLNSSSVLGKCYELVYLSVLASSCFKRKGNLDDYKDQANELPCATG